MTIPFNNKSPLGNMPMANNVGENDDRMGLQTLDTKVDGLTTDNITEGTTNFYFTNARARASITISATGLSYDSVTGIITLTTGYEIITTIEKAAFTSAAELKTTLDALTGIIISGGDGTYSAVTLDTDGTLSADSDSNIPTQKAIKTYADNLLAANDALVFKDVIDCSTNPNYPAADCGHLYIVSVAGKIGGASGVNVEINDTCYCRVDSTASGDQATVGANWVIVQANIDGAVIGPASSTDGNVCLFDGVTGKLIKNSTIASTDVASAITNDHTHSNKATLDNIEEALTTALKSAYDGAVTHAAKAHGYALQAHSISSNPADSTTYYIGSMFSVGLLTTPTWWKIFIPKSGTIKGLYLHLYQNAGSSETSSMWIRVNNTTDHVAFNNTITNDAKPTAFSNSSLNISVTAGDYIELKWTTPAWTTNPTGVRVNAVLWIEY